MARADFSKRKQAVREALRPRLKSRLAAQRTVLAGNFFNDRLFTIRLDMD
jgi:hypothetical protein